MGPHISQMPRIIYQPDEVIRKKSCIWKQKERRENEPNDQASHDHGRYRGYSSSPISRPRLCWRGSRGVHCSACIFHRLVSKISLMYVYVYAGGGRLTAPVRRLRSSCPSGLYAGWGLFSELTASRKYTPSDKKLRCGRLESPVSALWSLCSKRNEVPL